MDCRYNAAEAGVAWSRIWLILAAFVGFTFLPGCEENGTVTPPQDEPCPVGYWDHDGLQLTACVAWSTCSPGEYLRAAGTPVSDTDCVACAAGTFSLTENAASCTAWTDCARGSYVERAGSPTEDRTCAVCDGDTYSDRINATECVSARGCGPGTYVLTEGSETTERRCIGCPDGTWDHDSDPTTRCIPHAVCEVGSYVHTPPTRASDAVCLACFPAGYSTVENAPACTPHIPCAAGYNEVVAPTPTSPNACEVCEEGTWDHDANSATACVPHRICAPGTSVISPGTHAANTECAACDAGSFSDSPNATACTPHDPCLSGTLATPGTATTQSVCTECPPGTWNHDRNPLTSCVAYGDCFPGSYVSKQGSGLAPRECTECASGTYSDTNNQSRCNAHAPCGAGSWYSTVPTDTRRGVCTPCAPDTWDHDRGPYTACVSQPRCTAGTYQESPGTSTVQRVCTACPANTYNAGGVNVPACEPHTICVPGERRASNGSRTWDASCTPCDEGTFSTTTNAPSCSSHTVCALGEDPSTLAMSSRDRVCEDCYSVTYPNRIGLGGAVLQDEVHACGVATWEALPLRLPLATLVPKDMLLNDNGTIAILYQEYVHGTPGQIVFEERTMNNVVLRREAFPEIELPYTAGILRKGNGGTYFFTVNRATSLEAYDASLNFTTLQNSEVVRYDPTAASGGRIQRYTMATGAGTVEITDIHAAATGTRFAAVGRGLPQQPSDPRTASSLQRFVYVQGTNALRRWSTEVETLVDPRVYLDSQAYVVTSLHRRSSPVLVVESIPVSGAAVTTRTVTLGGASGGERYSALLHVEQNGTASSLYLASSGVETSGSSSRFYSRGWRGVLNASATSFMPSASSGRNYSIPYPAIARRMTATTYIFAGAYYASAVPQALVSAGLGEDAAGSVSMLKLPVDSFRTVTAVAINPNRSQVVVVGGTVRNAGSQNPSGYITVLQRW